MREYRFVTTWRVEAPRAAVWDAIRHSERWPAWWSGVVRVEELAAGEPDGVGNLRRYTFRSRLPYALTFDVHATLVDPPARLWGDAQGDLVGTGRWFFATEEPGVTLVRYGWHVATTSRWMNLLGPFARPIFAWNHDMIMRWGEDGLRRHLGLPPLARPAASRRPLAVGASLAIAATVLLARRLRRRR